MHLFRLCLKFLKDNHDIIGYNRQRWVGFKTGLFYLKGYTLAKRKKKLGTWYKIKQIFWRMVATFTANGLATIGAGSLIGIDIIDAIVLAGTLGVVKVSEDLARAFLDDGNLSIEEINDAFSKIDRSKK